MAFNYTIASYRNLNPLDNNPYNLTQESSVEEDFLADQPQLEL